MSQSPSPEESDGRRVARNIGFIAAGKFFADFCTFGFFVVLARVYGETGLGSYSFAMATTGMLAAVADMGLSVYSIRSVGAQSESYASLVGKLVTLRLLLCSSVLILLFVALQLYPVAKEVQLLLLLTGSYHVAVTLVEGFAAIFVAREEAHWSTLLQVSLRMSTAVTGAAIALSDASLNMAVAALPVLSLLHVVFGFVLLSKRYGTPTLASVQSSIALLRESFSYFLHAMIGQISTRMPIFLIGLILSIESAGIFNAPYRITFFLYLVFSFALLGLLPTASRIQQEGGAELRSLYQGSLALIVVLAAPLSAGLALISQDITVLFYGEAFAESASILPWLCMGLFFSLLRMSLGTFLTALGRQSEVTAAFAVTTTLNVAAIWLLTGQFGLIVPAWSIALAEVALAITYLVKLRPLVGWPVGMSALAVTLTGVLTMALILGVVVPQAPIWIKVPLGALAYGSVLALSPRIRGAVLGQIRSLLSSTKTKPI